MQCGCLMELQGYKNSCQRGGCSSFSAGMSLSGLEIYSNVPGLVDNAELKIKKNCASFLSKVKGNVSIKIVSLVFSCLLPL